MKDHPPGLKGRELLRDPSKNKGTAFTNEERARFGLHGLLPAHVSTIEEQVKRRYENFSQKQSKMDKYAFLADLHNRNETLYFKLVQEHIDEMLPYIYTPVVGDASIEFSLLYNQSRGLFLSPENIDQIEEILKGLKIEDLQVIVVTDGGRVLGLGDVGIGGMVIPIGKSALYTLFGGINPTKTLPIFLDVGCNTEQFLQDENYIGTKKKRLSGVEYYNFIEKFVLGVKKVYPNVLLQWEDFPREHANVLLERYRDVICSFNDDIQGTASVALSAIISALKMKEEEIKDQKIAIFGAGSAGMGIANILVQYMRLQGMTEEDARNAIHLIDQVGLIHKGLSEIRPEHQPFIKEAYHNKRVDLEKAIEDFHITILVGVSAQKDAFTRGVITKMLSNTVRPIVLPLSNPNSKSEISPENLIKWTRGKAIVATGSPNNPVEYKNTIYDIEQCNNVFIFPSIGLAVAAFHLKKIPDEIFVVAAEALAGRALPAIFPRFTDLKETIVCVAEEIGKYALKEGLIHLPSGKTMKDLIKAVSWEPRYV